MSSVDDADPAWAIRAAPAPAHPQLSQQWVLGVLNNVHQIGGENCRCPACTGALAGQHDVSMQLLLAEPGAVPPAEPLIGAPESGPGHRGRLAAAALPLILVVQAALSLRLIWSNAAFGDEALYLWAGHLEWSHWLHGMPLPEFAAYFSGAPVIYPPLGALADTYGGLAAARLLSTGFLLIATWLLYLTAHRLLLNRTAATYAAAAFAMLGPTQSLAFATYDAMALMLIALAAWLGLRASGRFCELFLILAGLVMALANAAKYASALWDPAVVAIAIAASWHAGPWRRLLRSGRIGLYAAAALAVALFRFGGPSYIHGLLITTLARSSGTQSPLSVLGHGFDDIGPVAVLAALGALASIRSSPRMRFLCFSVVAACWAAPLNQARIHTLTSLHKHADFGAWFAAISAGYVIAAASRLQRERSWRIAVAVATVIPLTLISLAVSGDEYRWAPVTRLITYLRPLLRDGSAHYLFDPESANIAYYYLGSRVSPDQISLLECAWWDPALRHELVGPAGCAAAIKARYYQIVETDDAADGPQGTPAEVAVWRAIAASGAYRLIYRVPEQYHPKDFFQVWELIPGSEARRGARS